MSSEYSHVPKTEADDHVHEVDLPQPSATANSSSVAVPASAIWAAPLRRSADSSPPAERHGDPSGLDRCLWVGSATDACERDADIRAGAAMHRLLTGDASASASAGTHQAVPVVERSIAAHGTIGTAGGVLDPAHQQDLQQQLNTGGAALPAPLAKRFGAALSGDVSTTRVHNTPTAHRLARQVSSEAFTTGRDVFFAEGAYRPDTVEGQYLLAHELSHVDQNKPGQALHRSVHKFDAVESDSIDPPASDLVKTLAKYAAGQFEESDADVAEQIRTSLRNPLVRPVTVPGQLEVTLDSDEPQNHPVRSARQSKVGQMGEDEFFIRTGIVESFEGGHLVGHQFWDSNDQDVDQAGGYLNLVPMSRTRNINAFEGWQKVETQLANKMAELQQRDDIEQVLFTITIDNSGSYEITLGQIAKHFGLNLKAKADASKKIAMDTWIPGVIKSTYENIDTGSDMEIDDIEENALHNFDGPGINSPKDLLAELRNLPLYHRLDPKLLAKLEKL